MDPTLFKFVDIVKNLKEKAFFFSSYWFRIRLLSLYCSDIVSHTACISFSWRFVLFSFLSLQICIVLFSFSATSCLHFVCVSIYNFSSSICLSLSLSLSLRALSLLYLWWGQPLHGDETDRGWLKWSLICWENWPQSELFYQEDAPLLSVSLHPSLLLTISLTLIHHPLFSLTHSLSMSVLPISHPPFPAFDSHFSSSPIHSQWSLSICHRRLYCSVMLICPSEEHQSLLYNQLCARNLVFTEKSTLEGLAGVRSSGLS